MPRSRPQDAMFGVEKASGRCQLCGESAAFAAYGTLIFARFEAWEVLLCAAHTAYFGEGARQDAGGSEVA